RAGKALEHLIAARTAGLRGEEGVPGRPDVLLDPCRSAGPRRMVLEYNTTRPHQALEMAKPAERFRLTPLAKGRASVPVDSGEDHNGQWVLRRVGSNGMVSVENQLAAARERDAAVSLRRLFEHGEVAPGVAVVPELFFHD